MRTQLVPVIALSAEFLPKLPGNRLQRAILGPLAKAVVSGSLGSVVLCGGSPGRPWAICPEDAAHDLPAVLVGPAVSTRLRQSVFCPFELFVGRLISVSYRR